MAHDLQEFDNASIPQKPANQPIPAAESPELDGKPLPTDDYKLLVESFAQAVWETDATGRVVIDSPSWRAYTGQSLEEWLGEGWVQAVHPDDRSDAQRQWQESIRAQKAINAEFRLCTPGSGWQWTNIQATPIMNPAGSVSRWLGLNVDITERKRTEEVACELEERTRIAIDAAEMATWEWNLITDEAYWNERHFLLLGMEPKLGPVDSDAFLSHVHPDDRGRIQEELRKTIEERTVYDAEFRAVRDDRIIRWMSGYGRITEETNGQPSRMSGVMFDITARKQAEEALRDADRRKDEFLAMLAHELRNPLAPVRNILQILTLTGGDDERVSSAVEMMSRQVDHLVRLVDDLLDVSRISRGKIKLRRERIELTRVVQEAAAAIRSAYQTGHRELVVTVLQSPVYLNGDATRLAQVVSNLLTNGLRYTREGGHVWLIVEPVDNQVLLRVRDDGIGLAADQLERIFELFVQVDTSLDRSRGGLGLGLTLVRKLVEMHGGRVKARSGGLDQGSEFIIYLPILIESEKSMSTLSEKPVLKTPGRQVLVVDDNRDAATTLAMLLKLKGYEVQTRYGGREALQAAESLHPDIVLLDIGMPELDGYETCRLIRQQPWGRDLVLIALTGYGQEEDKQRTRETGFNGHLVKPVELPELIALMDTLLSART